MASFHSLRWSAVAEQPKVAAIDASSNKQKRLDWHQSVQWVVDDFTKHQPVQLSLGSTVVDAERGLNTNGRRYACVLDANEHLIGILAARELHSRRSIALANALQRPWAELTVEDLMIPVSKLPQISSDDLTIARIGDAAATMQQTGADYLLVHKEGAVIGLISSLGIAELTGESVKLYHRASSFSEIVHAVNHTEALLD